MRAPASLSTLFPLFLFSTLPVRVFAGNVLSTNGFVSCQENPTIQVQTVDVQFDRSTNQVTFNVAGRSTKSQKVTASVSVSAYGNQVWSQSFDPCDHDIKQLCPVPAGEFSAAGQLTVPQQYVSMIPSIAYTIPNLDGDSQITLHSKDDDTELACIEAKISNGKTAHNNAVKYTAAGIAGAALIVSGVSAIAAAGGGTPGASTSSPSFHETIGWLQTIATTGMLSVPYPAVYQSFTQNFGFSTGLVTWTGLQRTIDNFRNNTGGNLYHDNIEYLQNVTLVQTGSPTANISTRDLSGKMLLAVRDIVTHVNGTGQTVGTDGKNGTGSASPPQQQEFVSGIKGYVEALTIPQSNTFMTILLIFSIVLAAIIAGILLFKVILEAWALFASFPKKLTSFRKNYWWLLAKTITNLVLLLYGVWTIYCVYQFTNGDSWAAKVLAGVTLTLFTLILAGFTWKIWYMAHRSKKVHGDASFLYEDKETWRKYSIFYDNFKKNYWWVFVPSIIYMFAKGCVIAAGDGHGLAQTAGQLIVDGLMLTLLLFIRPYTRRSGNWINVTIQVVRVITMICILIFCEQFGVSETGKTVTGLILIVIQCVLTALLGILIAVNAIMNCVRMNPHRRRRKEAEKLNRDLDDLTPLDARNSLLMYPMEGKDGKSTVEVSSLHTRGRSQTGYDMVSVRDATPLGYRDDSVPRKFAHYRDRSSTPSATEREPQLPDIGYRPGPGIAL